MALRTLYPAGSELLPPGAGTQALRGQVAHLAGQDHELQAVAQGPAEALVTVREGLRPARRTETQASVPRHEIGPLADHGHPHLGTTPRFGSPGRLRQHRPAHPTAL